MKTPTELVQGNMMDDSAYNHGSFRADWLLNLVTTESKTFVKINPDKWFFPADISMHLVAMADAKFESTNGQLLCLRVSRIIVIFSSCDVHIPTQ
jgi:hypothetical protein